MRSLTTRCMAQVMMAMIVFSIGLSAMASDSKALTLLANQGDTNAQNKLGY